MSRLLSILLACLGLSQAADILMVTMGGTKSHKIPFWELSRGLINRGHNITFLNGFPADFSMNGLQEITPAGLVDYIQNFTNWDLLGARINGGSTVTIWEATTYATKACEKMLNDAETKELLNRQFDLIVIDGAYPECSVGMAYKFKAPFMYFNTVGFYMGSISRAGNPTPYAVNPIFVQPYTDSMTFIQRIINAALHIFSRIGHQMMVNVIHQTLQSHFGESIPHPYELSKNVSFILQNGHATLSYPRAYMPNVAEIACIHCKAAKSLPKDLEDFVNGSGDAGFIYVSMGSSVKAANMPESLRRLLVRTFSQLPYRVLWKWEGATNIMSDLSKNVKLSRWLPQQDVLGHPKLRAFVTHGGLLSMYETVYHAVPVVTMPVFCDHDVNSAKAELDGYAIKLDLATLTSDQLTKTIFKIIHDPKYRQAAKRRQYLLRDLRETPLDTAVYWTEYVIRHRGAPHLMSPAKDLSFIQLYSLDVLAVSLLALYVLSRSVRWLLSSKASLVDLPIKHKLKKLQ